MAHKQDSPDQEMRGTNFYASQEIALRLPNMKVVLSQKFLLLFLFVMGFVHAVSGNTVENIHDAEARALTLQHRLEEIKAMDKESLSRDEKRLLKREVRAIKKELATISGGVYLSVGAIILIALLLILLL